MAGMAGGQPSQRCYLYSHPAKATLLLVRLRRSTKTSACANLRVYVFLSPLTYGPAGGPRAHLACGKNPSGTFESASPIPAGMKESKPQNHESARRFF